MFNKTHMGNFQRAIATADKHDANVAKLEELAKHMPQFADRVQALKTKLDHIRTVSTIALS